MASCLALVLLLAVNVAVATTNVRNFKVDYLVEPLTIQTQTPSFSWLIDASDRGFVPQGYVLDVHEVGAVGTKKLWSTGQVTSNQTTFIMYDGPALTSDTDYTATVTLPDGTMATTTFSTALFQMSDWAKATWVNVEGPAAQARNEFTIAAGAITRARAYFAMPGYGTLWINGHSVDGITGTRTWSQYDKRSIYGVYDIAEYLVEGKNVVGVYAGRGWYGHWYGGVPAFRLLLSISQATTKTQVGSSTMWKQTPGPVQANDEYNGETYDARLETPGWTSPSPSFNDATWTAVTDATQSAAFHLTNTSLDSMSFAPVDVMHEFTAKWWKEPSPGVYVFEFDQNLSGWIRLALKYCRSGLRIQFRHAELLQHPPYGPEDGNIYVGNLRGAQATDVYICKGDPNGETWQPTFTQHGFTFLEVTGLETPPTLDMFTAINVRSSVEQVGAISFSDSMLNKVQHNILWGQSTNLMMIPTDCDQRDERLGWTGDSALTSEEALYNYDLGAFYHNWAKMIDESSPNGAVPDTIPTGPGGGNSAANTSADASWASVYPSVVWGLLKYNGDTTVGKFWDGLTRFMDNEWSHLGSPPVITNIFAQFGDWVPPPSGHDFIADGKVSIQYSAGYSFLGDLVHTIELAKHVGTAADVAKYTSVLSQAMALFHAHWYDAAKGYYENGSQTAQVLALAIPGLVPANITNQIVAHLVNDIIHVHGNHTTCGIIGWRWELDVLSAYGFADVAYALITQTTYPSYGYEINNPVEPATTIWELWDSDAEGPGMNSRDHIMFGGPGKWVYSYVGGISQTETSIGFEHVVLTPPATLIEQALAAPNTTNSTTSAPLTFTSASHETLRGVIALEWGLPTNQHSSTCGDAKEGDAINLACTSSTIQTIAFASYGTSTGSCTSGFAKSACNLNSTVALVEKCCVGKESCVFECGGQTCDCVSSGVSTPVADPCYQTVKHLAIQVTCAAAPKPGGHVLNLNVQVPVGSDSQLVVPLLGSSPSSVMISENGTAVFKNGAYVAGVSGVTGAMATKDSIVIEHGSGSYRFIRTG
eukprot:m.192534 g.192534  ORF g.192534 m.192534 type:complete len:1045 (-) comp32471_c0_seq1:82-3216(-)